MKTRTEPEVRALLARLCRRPEAELTDDRQLRDIIHDSFDMIEVILDLQDQLGVRLDQDSLRRISTVGDLVRVVSEAA